MPDKEIQLTNSADIVAMTRSLPDIVEGARPFNYEQTVEPSLSAKDDAMAAKPDPVHNY
jgi:hypothetical protein